MVDPLPDARSQGGAWLAAVAARQRLAQIRTAGAAIISHATEAERNDAADLARRLYLAQGCTRAEAVREIAAHG